MHSKTTILAEVRHSKAMIWLKSGHMRGEAPNYGHYLDEYGLDKLNFSENGGDWVENN